MFLQAQCQCKSKREGIPTSSVLLWEAQAQGGGKGGVKGRSLLQVELHLQDIAIGHSTREIGEELTVSLIIQTDDNTFSMLTASADVLTHVDGVGSPSICECTCILHMNELLYHDKGTVPSMGGIQQKLLVY